MTLLNHFNAKAKMDDAARRPPPVGDRRFDGRGIVICAGGLRLFTCAWVCINVLRRLGCRLPIQVWHLGTRELGPVMKRLLEPLGVECVDALEVRARFPVRTLQGWELKPYSIVNCPFREVLLLDADNVPLVDPEYLFDASEYRDCGAIFWPDFGRLRRGRALWRLTGIPYVDDREFETGQIVVDRSRCWKPLDLTLWMNEHSDFWYRHMHGDKETFHLSWRKLGAPYAMPARGIHRLPGTMCQHDFDGRRIFQHRNTAKWSLGYNRVVPGFEMEDACFGFLRELRTHWRDLQGLPPSDPSLSAVAATIVDRNLLYGRSGDAPGSLRLHADGTVHTGERIPEHFWTLGRHGGAVTLQFFGDAGCVARLTGHPDHDGFWRGGRIGNGGGQAVAMWEASSASGVRSRHTRPYPLEGRPPMDVATDSGLRTLVEWHTAGPRLWADLHRWALRPDLAKAGPWLAAFSRRIKCGECRRHWTQWVNAHPPRLSDAASLFAWTVAAHNAVNRKLGKPEFTLHWATQHWEAVAVTEGPLQTQDEFMFSDVDLKPATGSRRPSPGAVNCHHASPVPRRSNVRCAIGLYGGAPHVSICADCAHRQPRDPSLPAVGDAPLPTPADADLRFEAAEIADPAGSAVASEAPTPRPGQGPAGNVEHLMLRSRLSPGDILMLTAAVRDLHRAYPGRFATSVETSVPALWENNPHVCVADTPAACRTIDMQYPLINQSNQRPVHFLQGYCDYLSSQLGLPLVVSEFRGDVHVSDEERRWTNQVTETFGYAGRFWIIVAGGKFDFTAKWWPPAYYQRVVDHFLGRVQFVQCGERDHWHPPLKGVFNLIGRTSVRQFVRLMYHAEGVICPVTFAMHLAAAVPTKTGRLRPCVVVAGGREPPHWEAYPGHHFLHTVGCLPCCATGGCWKSRCQTLADGDRKDRENLCERPVQVEPDLRVPQCMAMVQPADVIRAVERALSYDP